MELLIKSVWALVKLVAGLDLLVLLVFLTLGIIKAICKDDEKPEDDDDMEDRTWLD